MKVKETQSGKSVSARGINDAASWWLTCVALVVLLGVSALLQARVDRLAPKTKAIGGFLYVPSGTFLRQAALGYEQAWADLLWLKTIGYYADQETQAGKFTHLYHMIDIITSLDPNWLYPYLFGGVTLSLDLDRPDLANKLLRKAIPRHPNVWKIPFLIGYNAYFGLRDAKTAGLFMERASRLPGAPAYLARFSSRLHAKGGSRSRALQILKEIIHQTEDPVLRKRLVRRYEEILAGKAVGPYEQPRAEENP